MLRVLTAGESHGPELVAIMEGGRIRQFGARDEVLQSVMKRPIPGPVAAPARPAAVGGPTGGAPTNLREVG